MALPDFDQALKSKRKIEDEFGEPPRFKVLLHNDDFTTMDFVVKILEEVFHKNPSEAVNIMLHVHQRGLGECGTYPAEIAETKVDIIHARARTAGFPLLATMEEV